MIRGVYQTPFLSDDKQVTHVVCMKDSGSIHFMRNSDFSETSIASCNSVFQGGPLVYQLQNGITEENFFLGTYIGQAHKRTALVVMESITGKQDIWFLTVNAPVTLKELRNIVLRETRFADTYKNISILNLD